MSVQWTLIAGVLYAEIFVVLLLILPIFSPSRWNRILNSKFMKGIRSQASWYFYFILIILILFLIDAVREMRKYSNVEIHEHTHSHLDSEMQNNMRLFRAQRNFYISGFALFLSFVIRRLLHLMITQASLIAQTEAALKQAQSASAAAKNILQQRVTGEEEQNAANEVIDKEVKELKAIISSLEEELEKATRDKEAVKSQAASVTKEYDRLMKEHSALQEQISASGDKKHD